MNDNWLNNAKKQLKLELQNNSIESISPNHTPQKPTPRELIHQHPGFLLFHYKNPNTKPKARIIITFALINRPYIVDIPGRSLIQKLLNANYEIYLIEWTEPQLLVNPPSWQDYSEHFLDQALNIIKEKNNNTKTILFGICQGALLSLIYSQKSNSKIDALILSGIPFNYAATEHPLVQMVKWLDFTKIKLPIWPGEGLSWLFKSLNPLTLHYGKFINTIDENTESESYQDFHRIEKWVHDIPPISGPAFKTFLNDHVLQNKWNEKKLKIKIPILNIISEDDTIVPPKASLDLKNHIAAKKYHEFILKGGHLTPYISPRAQTEWLYQLDQFIKKELKI